ncbi:MAG: patatin-like phospholipase family protein [Candidatus Margulisbacteria bacterium]|nr:patatin-like phospholipase family protein [Candidatus Margulisiibacteriota bacterium]
MKLRKILFIFILLSLSFSFTHSVISIEAQTDNIEDTKKALVFRLTPENYKDYFPKIGLALGGGSAKGLAHLGIIKMLEEENIPVACIAGTSIGSIVGSLYASGYSVEEIRNFFKQMDYEEAFDDRIKDKPAAFSRGSLNNPTLFRFPEEAALGLNSGLKAQAIMRNWTLNQAYQAYFNYDALPIKLRIVATDFLTGEKVVFKNGPIDRAVRASSSIPYIFKPLAYKDTYLIDGGAVEIVPIDEVLTMQADIVIGVNVGRVLPLKKEETTSFTKYSEHLFDVLVKTAMDKNFKQADLIIDIPPTQNLSPNDYMQVDDFINYGQQYAQKMLPYINKKIAEKTLDLEKYILKEVTFEGINQKQDIIETDLAYNTLEIARKIYPLLIKHNCTEAQLYLLPEGDYKYKLQVVFIPAQEIKKITWQGNRIPFSNELKKSLEKYQGSFFNPQTKKKIELAIENYYRSKGYILVELTSNYAAGELNIEVYEVPIIEISIEGNKYLSAYVIESFLKFKLPEIYNANKVEKAVQQLYATELFEQVEPEVIRQEEGVHLKFNLIERPYGIFYANAQYYSAENKVELEAGHKNNYTFGYQLKSYFRFLTGPKNDINLGLAHYNIFDTGLGWGFDYLKHQELISLYDKHDLRDNIFNDQEENSCFLEYWFLNYSIASLTYKTRKQYILDRDKIYIPNYQRDIYTVAFDFKWDTLEKDFLANKGGNFRLHSERDDSLPYEKSWISSTLAFPLQKKISINLKNYLGQSSGETNYYDHFFLRRKWLPFGFADFEAQGPNVYYSRLSYRFPLADILRAEIGINLFRSWRKTGTALDRFENTGAAFTIHYPSFIGLASFTYGVRDDKNSVWLVNLSNELEE